MYRRLFFSVYQFRNLAKHAKEACVLTTKCDAVTFPIFRDAIGGGLRALGTTSTAYSEKKDLPGSEDIKDEAKNGGELWEAASVGEKRASEAREDVKITAEQVERVADVNTEGEDVTKHLGADVNTDGLQEAAESEETTKTEEVEQSQNVKLEVNESEHPSTQQVEVEGEQEPEKPQNTKKDSLLDLLGSMKVQVTRKKQAKDLRAQTHIYEPVVKPKPAPMESTAGMFQRATADAPLQSETLSPELVSAVSAAASTLPNRSQAESELLTQLRQHKAVTDAHKKGGVSDIGVLIADMKVIKTPNRRQNTRLSDQSRFDEDGRGHTHDRGITSELSSLRRSRGSLFSGKRLNIFPAAAEQDVTFATIAPPTLWDIELANQIALATTQTPRNGFEEMIQWTKEGKLWQYPINNEAGMEEEASVPFHEHVFLEKHLEDGFPQQGPVRHFMELVVAGLAKNPYLTVLEKKEHIAWFKEYFQQKEDVLKEAEVYLN